MSLLSFARVAHPCRARLQAGKSTWTQFEASSLATSRLPGTRATLGHLFLWSFASCADRRYDLYQGLLRPTKAIECNLSCTTIPLPSGGGAFRRFFDLRHLKALRRKQWVKLVFNLISLSNSHSSRACQGKILPASIEQKCTTSRPSRPNPQFSESCPVWIYQNDSECITSRAISQLATSNESIRNKGHREPVQKESKTLKGVWSKLISCYSRILGHHNLTLWTAELPWTLNGCWSLVGWGSAKAGKSTEWNQGESGCWVVWT